MGWLPKGTGYGKVPRNGRMPPKGRVMNPGLAMARRKANYRALQKSKALGAPSQGGLSSGSGGPAMEPPMRNASPVTTGSPEAESAFKKGFDRVMASNKTSYGR